MADTMPVATKTRKKKPSGDVKIQENEIRVTAQGKMRNYVAYASTIFAESKSNTVVLKGMGRVINKTVSLAEILKRRVKGLYQLAEIGSIQVVDKKTGKGNEESSEIARLLSVIKIILTTAPEDRAKFQPPVDDVSEEPVTTPPPKKGRTRNRKKTKKQDPVEQEAVKKDATPKKTPPPRKESAKSGDTPEESADASGDKKSAAKTKPKRRPNRKPKKFRKEAVKGEAATETVEANGAPVQTTPAEDPPCVDSSV